MRRPTRRLVGPARLPLDAALGAPARVALLRLLAALPAPLSQREAARRAAIQVRSAQQALDVLVALGIVRRTVGGRDHLVQLNRAHHLAPALIALFDVEAGAFLRLRETLVAAVPAALRREVRALALFGSAARGDDTLASDLDLLLITAERADREGVREALEEAAAPVADTFGVRPRILAYAIREARARYHRHDPPFDTIGLDAIPLLGPPLRELLA